MGYFTRSGLAACGFTLILGYGSLLPTAKAAAQTIDVEIDLTDPARNPREIGFNKLINVTQDDPRWSSALIGPNEDVEMARCGCYLAALSTVMDYLYGYGLAPLGSAPWFPVTLRTGDRDPSTGGFGVTKVSTFNPRYLDQY